MNTSELDDVTALLERVLPDPAGFAERLVEQFITRWAGGDLPAATRVVVRGEAETRDADMDTGIDPVAADSTLLLAAALGACDCWGTRPDCVVCAGEGASGWTEPDVELFREFVGPALARLSADQQPPASPGTTETDPSDDHTDGDPA
jgi:hypothetical protein